MKKILFCSDLSENCNSLSSYLSSWVAGTDIIVDVMHAYDPTDFSVSSINTIDTPTIQEERKIQVNGYLDTFLTCLPEQNRGEKHLVADKSFATAICMTADNIKADMIVSGLREKYTLMDKFMGSTAATLIKMSK